MAYLEIDRLKKMFACIVPLFRRFFVLLLLLGSRVGFLGIPVTLLAQSSTTTNLTLSSSSVARGTPVTLTAAVSANGSPVNTGVVSFYQVIGNSKLLLSSQPLTTGSHTAVLKYVFGVGSWTVEADFQQTNSFSGSFSRKNVTVTGSNATNASLASSGSIGNYTLTGTVNALGIMPPTGDISFEDVTNGNSVLAVQSLDAATLTRGFIEKQSCSDHSCSAGENPYWIGNADFNGDGILDLILATSVNTTNLDLYVYLGSGDGTFNASSPSIYFIGFGNAIMFPSIVDVNRDGIPDLVLPMYSSSQIGVMLGDGAGHFGSITRYSLSNGSNPFAVSVIDLNGDGIVDLAVANYGDGSLSTLLGNGDGTFQAPVSRVVGTRLGCIAAADLNHDGKMDVVVADDQTGAMHVLLGNGDGTFQADTSYSTGGSYASSVVIGDFNEDGSPDIAVASTNVVVFLNDGNGSFSNGTENSAGGALWYDILIYSDFNLDGHLDLAVVNASHSALAILQGRGDGTFSPAKIYSTESSPQYISAGDFNQDGLPDLALLLGNGPLEIYLGAQSISATVTSLAVPGASGAHNVLASYAGDTHYSASISSTIALSGPAATTLSLSSSTIAGVYGDTVSVTGTLSPSVASSSFSDFQLLVDSVAVPASISYANGNVVAIYSELNAGSHTAVLSFGGNAQYHSTVSNPTTISIAKAVPAITWNSPAAITYGAALSSTQLNASASVGGTFVYAPASGAVLSAGAQTLTATFTPTDSTNYQTVVSTTQLSVNKATPTVNWATPTGIAYGTPLSAAQLDARASVEGTFAYSPASGTVLAAGKYILTATFIPIDTSNYSSVVTNTSLVVDRAASTIALFSSAMSTAVGQPVTLTSTVQTVIGGSPSGTVSFYDGNVLLGTAVLRNGQASYTAGSLVVGSHLFSAVYSGDSNFLGVSTAGSVAVTVDPQDFAITMGSNGTQTVIPGGEANYNFSVAPVSGTFTSPVTFALSGLPPGAAYTFSPSGFAAGTTGGPVVLKIQTAKSTTAARVLSHGGFALAIVFLPLLSWRRKSKRVGALLLLGLASLVSIGALSGCGASGTFAQASKDYVVTLTAVSGTQAHTTAFTLTVQ